MNELHQKSVLQLRPEDHIKVVQNGREKLLAVAGIIDYIRDRLIEALQTRAPSTHSHSEDEVTSLTTHLNSIATALANRAAINHGHIVDDIPGLQGILDGIGKGVLDTTVVFGAFPVVKSAIVAGGNAVFQLTANNQAAGAPLFPNAISLDSLMLRGEEGNIPHAFGTPVLSNSNKTLTVPVSKLGANVAILGISVPTPPVAANGSVIKAIIWGR